MILYDIAAIAADLPAFQVTERIQSEALGPVVQVSKVTIVARNAALTLLSEAPLFRFKWRFPQGIPQDQNSDDLFIYIYILYTIHYNTWYTHTHIYIYRYTPSFWVCFCLIFRWIIPSSNGL